MRLSINTHLVYTAAQPCDLLLQVEALSDSVQNVRDMEMTFDPASRHHSIPAEEDLGTRRWIQTGARFECHYRADVDLTRPSVTMKDLRATRRTEIPSDAIKYLMPSRYCHSDQFLDFVSQQFADLTGGALVDAMSGWINENFTYDSAASDVGTTANDSFAKQAGVCRDYAHVLISFARAAGIPARFVSVYGPDVTPQDFHAVAEVYLEGAWHLIDPTGMAAPAEMARICVGRDAADASFMTSYGWMDLVEQSVDVTRTAS